MIEPLFNPTDDEWISMVGKYILNMGSIEFATRILISIVDADPKSKNMNGDLPARLGYLRRKFPREPKEVHSKAMLVFDVALKHVGFRNIVAHSPIVISGHADGSKHIQGILNLNPRDPNNDGIIGLPELRGRVDESSSIGRDLLQMQKVFSPASWAAEESPTLTGDQSGLVG
ncbi:hypothetical protein C8R26_11044 [Nitrosomonas oligotropha]|uniref:Uncharacterized protein n=1 Tax=Nitrosomonas oligotropha TaxID=42354 RepID=A0A2T5HZX8_9PROT|nr:hypothetical protein [Nitrosomonas oligotropha]PTQ77124.1 hypothetical protein C8R26_11044 [Nitrosomonas oligotropha]